MARMGHTFRQIWLIRRNLSFLVIEITAIGLELTQYPAAQKQDGAFDGIDLNIYTSLYVKIRNTASEDFG